MTATVPDGTTSPSDIRERVGHAAREAIERFSLPGISIGVAQGDDVIFCEGYGFSDIESARPLEPGQRQCIASISKTMLGLCVMALVDEGRLTLDAKVTELLPDVRFDGPAETMTVWHLLTHTSGIGEAQTPALLASTVNPDADARRKPGNFGSLYEQGIVIEFVPGTKWHYANHGFNLLGEIVLREENAVHLNDVLTKRIFEPLGMHETDILGRDDSSLTTPYHRAPNDDTREQLTRAGIPIKEEAPVDGTNIRGTFGGEFNEAALASGGVQSNLPDMMRYASALLKRGGGIVRPETFDKMIGPQYCPDERFINWGLSFMRTPFRGRMMIGHGGAYFGGWNSHLDLDMEGQVAVVQHINAMLADPVPVFTHVLRAVYGVERDVVAHVATDGDVLEQAPGTYELTPARLTNFRPATSIGRIRIEREGDALKLTSRWGDWKRGVPLLPADSNDPLFFVIENDHGDPSPLVFTRGDDGRIDGLRCNRLVRMVKARS